MSWHVDGTGGLTYEQTDERSVDDRSKKQVGFFFVIFYGQKYNSGDWIEQKREERRHHFPYSNERVIVEKYPPK